MSTTSSIMLFRDKMWADALEKDKFCKGMVSIHRYGTLRVVCVNWTVSERAVLVISEITRIKLLSKGHINRIKQNAKKQTIFNNYPDSK